MSTRSRRRAARTAAVKTPATPGLISVSMFGASNLGQEQACATDLLRQARARFGPDVALGGAYQIPNVVAARQRLLKTGTSQQAIDSIVRFMLTTGGVMVEVVVDVPRERLIGQVAAPQGQN